MSAILDERISTSVALPCHLVEPETFFAELPADIEYAKSLCGPCPLREDCLAGALERREAAGVWGGQLFINGVVVARKRPRGRPRKHPLPDAAPAPASVTPDAAQVA